MSSSLGSLPGPRCTGRKSSTSQTSARRTAPKANTPQPSRKALTLLLSPLTDLLHQGYRQAHSIRRANPGTTAAALQSSLPASPQQSDRQLPASQQQHQAGLGLLVKGLSNGDAQSCRAALHQLQQSHQNMHVRSILDHGAATPMHAVAGDDTGVVEHLEDCLKMHTSAQGLYHSLAGLHDQIASVFLASSHTDWLIEYLAMLPPRLDEASYTVLVRACGRHGDAAALQHVIEARRQAGHADNKFTVTSSMAAWQKVGQTQRALAVFEQAVAAGIADVDVFNAAIIMCINIKQAKAAFDIFETMQPHGVRPNLSTFHSLFKGTSFLKAAGLRQLYSQMLSLPYVKLTDVTFHYVFRAAARCCNGLPAAWLFQVLADMPQHKVAMNSYILTAFFQACCGASLVTAQIEAAFGVAASYRSTETPSAFVYTALLTFCAKKAPEKALDVWHALQEDKVDVTAHVLSSLFSACAAAQSAELLEAAESSHLQLEGLWNKICAQGKTADEERDMLQAHNALLHLYASHGKVGQAEQLYAGMMERGPQADALSAASLIAAYAKVGDSQAALKTYQEMTAAGLQPTERCQTSLLAACARGGDLAAARQVFRGLGQRWNVPCYTALMDACLKEGSSAAIAEAFQLFEEMKANKLQPTATTYGCLLMMCARRGEVERAFQLYEEAYSRGVLATDECHNILISICADAGRTEEALELVKALASKHGHMEQPALNSVIRSLLHVGQTPRALRMLSIMTNKGLKPYRSTIDALVAGCARDSNSQDASAFYWGLRAQGGEASKASGSELIISLCKAGQPQEALQVYEDMIAPPLPPTPLASSPSNPWVQANKAQTITSSSGQPQAAFDDNLSSKDSTSNSSTSSAMSSSSGAGTTAQSNAALLKRGVPRTDNDNATHLKPGDSLLLSKPTRRSNPSAGPARDMKTSPRPLEADCKAAAAPQSGLQQRPVAGQPEQRHGAGEASRLELHSSTRLSQRVAFPSTAATAALVHAFALAGDLQQCHRLYKQLQRDRKGLAVLTQSHRRMWEAVIEAACRAGQVDRALQLFDDWKSASTSFVFVHSAQQSAVVFPSLSNVTLAFLEACCRGSEQHAWRVYDVCAAMRQQKERKREAALARPVKKSHHVADPT